MAPYQLNDIDIGYDNSTIALRNVSLTINRGEKVAFLGQSGSGKSSLLSYLYNTPSGQKWTHQNGTTYLPQDLGLVEPLSVFHNVYMGQLNQKPTWYNLINLIRPLKNEKEKIINILKSVDLTEKVLSPVKQLSGGQKQRTAIARALLQAHNSRALPEDKHAGNTLLADEPTTGLDERQSVKLVELLNQSFDTVVVAMHDIDLALNHFDRIIGLKDGCVYLNQRTELLTPEKLLCLYQ